MVMMVTVVRTMIPNMAWSLSAQNMLLKPNGRDGYSVLHVLIQYTRNVGSTF